MLARLLPGPVLWQGEAEFGLWQGEAGLWQGTDVGKAHTQVAGIFLGTIVPIRRPRPIVIAMLGQAVSPLPKIPDCWMPIGNSAIADVDARFRVTIAHKHEHQGVIG